ncbi:MAG: Rieske (2Fe-2S) protein [Cellvibrionaceae bacterium]
MHFLCYDHELKNGESKGFEINRKQFFAVKKNHTTFIYLNKCPHVGLPLNWQENKFLDHDGMLILCTSHGALFKIETGKCVAGPCTGRSLKQIPFEIENGKILIAESIIDNAAL